MSVPNLRMNNGKTIPQIGFGLWRVTDKKECIDSIEWALEAGYRHFDDAQAYENEQYLGEVVRNSKIPRDELFITTKIRTANLASDDVVPTFEESLKKLQMDYVDLLLIHFPVTETRAGAWKRLEELHGAGKAKSIGVSNYMVKHLEELLANCKVKPVVNQIELSVGLQMPEVVEFCKKNDIIVEAYTPLAEGNYFDDPTLKTIAEKHNKSVAQVMLRWCVDYGTVPLVKSVHQDRIKSNLDIFDFKLDADDMAKIKAMDENHRTNWDPTNVE
ncbi:MAG TPA: aldo/keto reductase [Candidatus Saccharimonadales bacterium]|nr:aldo/keto reductase [Candidatus Saccharimonadales bacterium]